jgi:hypothetical protein
MAKIFNGEITDRVLKKISKPPNFGKETGHLYITRHPIQNIKEPGFLF